MKPCYSLCKSAGSLNRTRLLSAALLLAALHCPLAAGACAAAPPPEARVQVVDESAVIVWDASAHQEHFIRRATFNATSDDFGFLVPTPSAPALAEVNDNVFTYLEYLIRPEVIVEKQRSYYLSSLFAPQAMGAAAELKSTAVLGGVEVVSTQHVAGYDAVVLSADRADALLKWLKEHGYASRPALLAWLAPYVQAHWKITAFKISKVDPHSSQIGSSAVRMSFNTDRPFFPYREPADQREPGNHAPQRSLRVFLLGAARMEGGLGSSSAGGSWPGAVKAAKPLDEGQRHSLAQDLSVPEAQFSATTWLTTFEDRSSPRPGTDDVYFGPAAQQTPIVPPPVTVTSEERVGVPIEPFVVLAGLGVFAGIQWRRSRNRRPAQTGQ